MCGRYESWVKDDEIEAILELEKQGSVNRYLRQTEVFPGTVQPVLYGSRIRMRAHLSEWGLPIRMSGDSHANSSGDSEHGKQISLQGYGEPGEEEEVSAPRTVSSRRTFINARSETAAGKMRFAAAFRDGEPSPSLRRVIVPTSAYYEWSNGVKYRIADAGGELLFLAALEEDEGEVLRENAPDPARVYSCFSSAAMVAASSGADDETALPPIGRRHVILTREAEGAAADIHTRMPVFLRREECEPWLYNPDFARMRLRLPWKQTLSVTPA